jgi:hypothetical protein
MPSGNKEGRIKVKAKVEVEVEVEEGKGRRAKGPGQRAQGKGLRAKGKKRSHSVVIRWSFALTSFARHSIVIFSGMRYAVRGSRRANSCRMTPALATIANPELAEWSEGWTTYLYCPC